MNNQSQNKKLKLIINQKNINKVLEILLKFLLFIKMKINL
jgi:hypothetical protein